MEPYLVFNNYTGMCFELPSDLYVLPGPCHMTPVIKVEITDISY